MARQSIPQHFFAFPQHSHSTYLTRRTARATFLTLNSASATYIMCYYRWTVCAGAIMGKCKDFKEPRLVNGSPMPVGCKKFDGRGLCRRNGTVTMTGFNVYQTNHPEKTRIRLCSRCAKDATTCDFYDQIKGKYNGHAARTVKLLRSVLKTSKFA